MLNFNTSTNYDSSIELNKNINCYEDAKKLKSVYRDSEALSSHISDNILESLREQFSRQGLQIYLESKQELEAAD